MGFGEEAPETALWPLVWEKAGAVVLPQDSEGVTSESISPLLGLLRLPLPGSLPGSPSVFWLLLPPFGG